MVIAPLKRSYREQSHCCPGNHNKAIRTPFDPNITINLREFPSFKLAKESLLFFARNIFHYNSGFLSVVEL